MRKERGERKERFIQSRVGKNNWLKISNKITLNNYLIKMLE